MEKNPPHLACLKMKTVKREKIVIEELITGTEKFQRYPG
jgi:hypothetical protein